MTKQNLSERKFIQELLKDQDIVSFIDEYKISDDLFDTYLETFMAYYVKKSACKNCQGLKNCKQTRFGLAPILVKDGAYIDIDYFECSYKEENNKFNSPHLHLYNSSFINVNEKIFVNENRDEVLRFYKKFLESYESNPHQLGMYLHGSYGTGKSYIMASLAKSLADKQVDCAFVYYPDFVRMVKSMILTGGVNKLVDELKRVPVLFLDDFGGESNTNFIRDEVLLPILQYRMVNKLPLFITSNLSDKQIVDHLAESSKDIDVIKASRVFERIRSLVVFKELKDKNYR